MNRRPYGGECPEASDTDEYTASVAARQLMRYGPPMKPNRYEVAALIALCAVLACLCLIGAASGAP